MPRKATTSKSSKNVDKKPVKVSKPKAPKSKKKVKKVKVVEPPISDVEESSVPDSELPDSELPDSEVPVKKKRRVPSKETVALEFDELITVIEEEIIRLRESPGKAKGVKFLRSLGKRIKTLRGHSVRVMKQKKKTNRKNNTNSGFLKPVQISKEMAKFTGWDHTELRSRVDVTKYICKYIREHDLQNPSDRRQILADKKLSKLLEYSADDDEKPLTYYRIQTYMKKHFTNPPKVDKD